jgi:effector-binding domain-containing protein
MKISGKILHTGLFFFFLGMGFVMAIEEAKYTVVKKDGAFELRQYDGYILAETIISGDMENASRQAFRRLFNYISGDNQAQVKVAMTAPVSQEATGEKISMTAPVSQERMDDSWAVSFMMPASFTESTIPTPNDPRVNIRVVDDRKMATYRYSGRWKSGQYLKHKESLESWIEAQGLTIVGEAIWARFNGPFTLPFMRRNEVQIPVI